jgi:peptidoglycan hydrolase CwlO-like protein
MGDSSKKKLEEQVANLEERVKRLEDLVARRRFKISLTLEEARAELDEEVELTPELLEKAEGIIGIGQSGIPDLSERIHDYLYGGR